LNITRFKLLQSVTVKETSKSKILLKMQNTSTITLLVTQLSAAVFRYSTSAADTDGNQKIITDWNTCAKSTDCKGWIMTTHFKAIKGWGATNTVQKYKIFNENLISQWQSKKMAKKWPNFTTWPNAFFHVQRS